MKISVTVKTSARLKSIKRISERQFVVSVCERPEKGRANEAVARALSEYFKTPISQIKLISGFRASKKIFEL